MERGFTRPDAPVSLVWSQSIDELPSVRPQLMHESTSHIDIPMSSERSFAFVFAVVFSLIGFYPLLNSGEPRKWIFIPAGAILLIGLFAPRLLTKPNYFWFQLSTILGSVVSQIVMAILFLLIITPTGIALRASRRLRKGNSRTQEAAASTYWLQRGPDSNPMCSLRNQY